MDLVAIGSAGIGSTWGFLLAQRRWDRAAAVIVLLLATATLAAMVFAIIRVPIFVPMSAGAGVSFSLGKVFYGR